MRCTPLRSDVIAMLTEWLLRQPSDPVFPSSRGGCLIVDAFQRLVSRHVATACQACPSLKDKSVTPHKLRHAAAMSLLQHGVAQSGSATNRRRRHKSTCMLIWSLKNAHSRAPMRAASCSIQASRPVTRLPLEPLIMPTARTIWNRDPPDSCVVDTEDAA